MKTYDCIDIFHRRLKKIGIETEFVGNYPWIYLDKVNGKKVEGKFHGNHGFTAFFLNIDMKTNKVIPYKFSDMKAVFKKVRSTLNS